MATGMRVGFVGLGNAGWLMAEQLIAAGHELVVRDADEQRTAAFAAEHEARVGGTPESFAGVEVLFTMLPHGGVVREVLLGPDGIAAALSPGTVVVDTSSSNPIGTRELDGELAELGIVLIDAGVSQARLGDTHRAAITLMVGANDDAALELVRPLLEALSAYIFRVGPTGSGHAMKTLNNFTSGAALHAALDSLIAGHRYGLDVAMLMDAFTVSTGRNFNTEWTFKYKALPRNFERRYSVGLLAKDMGIAASLAQATGFESELFGLLERSFGAARDDIGYDEDMTATLLHWERQAGVELSAVGPNEQLAEVPKGQAADGVGGPRTVGFIGLGNAGAPMAAHLIAAGHRLLVHDADLERGRRFAAEHDCRAAERPEELESVDVLFTSLPDGAVRSVLLGESRLADRLAAGTVVVDSSSADPLGTRQLADELRDAGVLLVDAAVSVPHIGAIGEGRINFFVGADDDAAFGRVLPLLETMSEHIFKMGRTGAGQAAGTLNDYAATAGLHGALDSLIVGYRYGLDPATMLEVLNVSTGRVFATEETLRRYSLPRTFDTGYSLSLLVKDTAIALEFARELGLDTELFALVNRDFAAALEDLGDDDASAILRHWEHLAGAELPTATAVTAKTTRA